MKIDIIGCGESALKYKHSGNVTIGVNDCYKLFPVDLLVCVDLPSAFNRERLNVIINSTPNKFYTQCDEWRPLVSNYQKIKFANGSGLLTEINNKELVCYSNSSPFVAVVIAYKMGAKEIFLYGADYNTHPNFTNDNLKKVLNDFKNLNSILLQNGCKLFVSMESRLVEVLPPHKL